MKLVKDRTLQAILNDLSEGGESGKGILPLPSSEARGRMARHAVMQQALNNRVLKRRGFTTPSDLAG